MRTPLKEWCKANGITAIHQSVRENTNQYPFITFLRGEGEDSAENIYFSIKGASLVSAGQDVKSIAKDLYVVPVVNKDGESRLKLSFKGESTYMDVNEMF